MDLKEDRVLVLNRNWQPVETKSVEDAFCHLVAGISTALDIPVNDEYPPTPLHWKEWVKLPIRAKDAHVSMVSGLVRVPTVIILGKFDRVAKSKPKLSNLNLHRRDKFTCQYCGKKVSEAEWRDALNKDHVIPRDKGGKTTWENLVCSCIECNTRKANKLPHEAKMFPRTKPVAPKEMAKLVRSNPWNIEDWNRFIL